MKIREFEKWVEDGRSPHNDSITYDVIALAGEAGEVSSEWKRNARGNYMVEEFREAILLELGDVLYYVVRLGHDLGFSVKDIIEANVEKLENRKKYGKGEHGKRS